MESGPRWRGASLLSLWSKRPGHWEARCGSPTASERIGWGHQLKGAHRSPLSPRCRKLQQELCHIKVRAVALYVSSVSKMLLLISVSFTCFCLKAVLGTLCGSACVGWAVLCGWGLLRSKISCWLFQHQTLTVVISRRSPWNTAVVVVVSSPCAHGVIADAKTYLSSYYCYWALISSRNMNSGRMPQTFIN